MQLDTRPVQPVSICLLDGEERKFLLTLGAMNRLEAKFDKPMAEVQAFKLALPLLHEALIDKGDITEEALAELLPMNLEWLASAINKIVGFSSPDPSPSKVGRKRGRKKPGVEDGTGSDSGPQPVTTSD